MASYTVPPVTMPVFPSSTTPSPLIAAVIVYVFFPSAFVFGVTVTILSPDTTSVRPTITAFPSESILSKFLLALDLSWDTLTASVSSTPAVTWTIVRVLSAEPIETVSSTSETEPEPIATEFFAVASASVPNARLLLAVAWA